MFRWIGKQIDKLRTGNQIAQYGCGRWYVRYSDGKNQQRCFIQPHATTQKFLTDVFYM